MEHTRPSPPVREGPPTPRDPLKAFGGPAPVGGQQRATRMSGPQKRGPRWPKANLTWRVYFAHDTGFHKAGLASPHPIPKTLLEEQIRPGDEPQMGTRACNLSDCPIIPVSAYTAGWPANRKLGFKRVENISALLLLDLLGSALCAQPGSPGVPTAIPDGNYSCS